MKKEFKNDSFYNAIANRHSIRSLASNPTRTRKDIEEIIAFAQHAPSAFNMQSSRLVILMGQSHQAFWQIVRDELSAIVTGDFSETEKRLQGFQHGDGTILFFEDEKLVAGFKEQLPTYASHFDDWSQQNHAIFMYAIWSAFTAENIAASIQHYNPLVDRAVKERWEIPDSYRLIAQMPFGDAAEEPTPTPRELLSHIARWID